MPPADGNEIGRCQPWQLGPPERDRGAERDGLDVVPPADRNEEGTASAQPPLEAAGARKRRVLVEVRRARVHATAVAREPPFEGVHRGGLRWGVQPHVLDPCHLAHQPVAWVCAFSLVEALRLPLALDRQKRCTWSETDKEQRLKQLTGSASASRRAGQSRREREGKHTWHSRLLCGSLKSRTESQRARSEAHLAQQVVVWVSEEQDSVTQGAQGSTPGTAGCCGGQCAAASPYRGGRARR